MPDETHQHESNEQPMLLNARKAAKLLDLSEKTLWNHTEPRGNRIPVVRFGKTVRYSRAALEHWIAEQMNDKRDGATG